ncbi:heme-binding protein [Riemerella anatipestifer]|uniref:heme-binding protein n=1 Tax=Riemerella anatipestifer TaxID=34085 RepID=UPI001121E0A8|nr:heme-binding protein [Riemerella anatipestifer]QDE19278.1 heme-binding protein [Riemerella anatipestifer]
MKISIHILLFVSLLINIPLQAQSKTLYEPVLTGDAAMKMAQKAFNEANKSGHRISVTVVDQSGKRSLYLGITTLGCIPYEPVIKKPLLPILKKRNRRNCTRHQKWTIPKMFVIGRNILILDGGVPIYIDGKVVGGIGVGGAHGSEDVRIAKQEFLPLK